MKQSQFILVLLIAALALGDFASLRYLDVTHQRWPDLPAVILLALVFGQLVLTAAWFTFGRWNLVVRLLLSVGAAFGLALVAATATDGSSSVAPWFAMQLIALCVFAFPLWTARLLRWRIISADSTAAVRRVSGWQFSIWSLLSTTTAVAIALGTARQVNMPLLAWGEAIAFFSCVVVTGLLVLATAMGIRHPGVATGVTLTLIIVFCPLAGVVIGQTGLPPDDHLPQWAVFGFCYGTLIALAVLALRVAGYRLERGDAGENQTLPSRDPGDDGKTKPEPVTKSSDDPHPPLAVGPVLHDDDLP